MISTNRNPRGHGWRCCRWNKGTRLLNTQNEEISEGGNQLFLYSLLHTRSHFFFNREYQNILIMYSRLSASLEKYGSSSCSEIRSWSLWFLRLLRWSQRGVWDEAAAVASSSSSDERNPFSDGGRTNSCNLGMRGMRLSTSSSRYKVRVHLFLAANASLCINFIYLPRHANTAQSLRRSAYYNQVTDPACFIHLALLEAKTLSKEYKFLKWLIFLKQPTSKWTFFNI